jgi:transcriptional regulator with XRE-family HTH domain
MTLNDFLRGVPAPDWTRRPNAKDEVRIMARRLRNLGLDYEEIAARLGVSKSSVSLWVRDLPRPARLSVEECRKRSAEGSRRYWEAERPARKNVGDGYRGCLRIDVRRSGDLYRRIEGWVGGAMLATA